MRLATDSAPRWRARRPLPQAIFSLFADTCSYFQDFIKEPEARSFLVLGETWTTLDMEGRMFDPRDHAPGSDHAPDTPQASAERREGARHIAVMRVAKLRTPRGEELCLVRNISAGGLMAHIWSGLQTGDQLAAEFKSGHVAAGKVVWRRENRIGVQFDREVDVTAVLGGDEDPEPGFQPRAPRITLAAKGRLRCGARYYAIEIENISQGGMRIRCADADLDERIDNYTVVLSIQGLNPIEGTARWHGAGEAGIAFNTPLPLDTIARWIADNQA